MSGSSNQVAARELLAARKCYPPEALRRIEVAFLQYARLREPMRSEHPFQRPNWFFPGLDSAPWPDPPPPAPFSPTSRIDTTRPLLPGITLLPLAATGPAAADPAGAR